MVGCAHLTARCLNASKISFPSGERFIKVKTNGSLFCVLIEYAAFRAEKPHSCHEQQQAWSFSVMELQS